MMNAADLLNNPEKNKEIVKEKCKEGLKLIGKFISEDYKVLEDVLDEHDKVVDGEEVSENGELENRARLLADRLVVNDVFRSHFFKNIYKQDPEKYLAKFVGHDLRNEAGILIGYMDMLRNPESDEYIFWILKKIPFYCYVGEDILLRGLDKEKVPVEYKNHLEFDLTFTENILRCLQKNNAVSGLVKEKLNISILDEAGGVKENFLELIKSDEYVDANPGPVVNAVNNLIRNAADEEIGARNINLVVSRESDNLVFKVSDNGIGMPPSYLDSEHKDFVLRHGRTHRVEGTGYGLTAMHTRLDSMDVELNIVSRNLKTKDDNEGKVSAYSNSSENENKMDLKDFNTIFEIKVPIKNK